MSYPGEEVLSDDEIFFGKLSLKEFKKHIFLHNHGQNKTYNAVSPEPDLTKSLKIIETHSQPNLRCQLVNRPKFTSVPASPVLDNRKSDESFIQMENIVTKLCLPEETDKLELNNTLEVIDYILNNGPNQNAIKTEKDAAVKENGSPSPLTFTISSMKESTPRRKSLNKKLEKICIKESPKFFTPAKSVKKEQAAEFVTPSSVSLKSKTSTFKTPANPLFHKKPSASSLKKTPNKTNAYQHIASPIASYIKNCPQSPLVKDVHPRKPLPGPSSIPKFVKNPPQSKTQNKENINLPSVAYKSAKKTKMIYLPDEEKLPKSQWVKKTLPRPTVVKHERREITVAAKPLQNLQEDNSFANLSCVQAEVSVCTQKTAFKPNKHL